jgi:hypothetical protein
MHTEMAAARKVKKDRGIYSFARRQACTRRFAHAPAESRRRLRSLLAAARRCVLQLAQAATEAEHLGGQHSMNFPRGTRMLVGRVQLVHLYEGKFGTGSFGKTSHRPDDMIPSSAAFRSMILYLTCMFSLLTSCHGS